MPQKTVLVVDDEPDIRESLRDALSDEGYRVLVAQHGEEALQLLPRIARPCVIILDIIMPVMSGTEFYAAMKSMPDCADIPVLISTSDPSRAPTAVPIIKKPINLDRLLEAVAACFEGQPPFDAGGGAGSRPLPVV